MLTFAVRMAARGVAALFAIACATLVGAALVTATGVLAESGLASHLPAGRLGGADVVISANQTYRPAGDLPIALPERATVAADLVDRLARLPGVTAAVGDLSFPAALIDGTGRVVPVDDPRVAGHGWSSTVLLDAPRVEGVAPAGPGEVAVDSTIAAAAEVGPGDQVHVVANGHTGDYRVSAVVTGAGAGILFDDPTAARLAGRDRGPRAGSVDLIGVRVAPGSGETVAAQARDLLHGSGLTVATGSARGDAEAPASAASRSVLLLISGSLAGITLLIVGFIVAGASTVSIGGQRRELALLRAVGATPRQIRRLAATQATVVTAGALLPGAALGYLLAEQFRRLLVSVGMLPDALALRRSPLPALAAAVLSIAVVQVAARCAAWRTSRLNATEAVSESRSEPKAPSRTRTSVGLLLIVGAGVLSVVPLLSRSQAGAAATPLAGIIAAIGLALSGPELVRRTGQALARRLPTRVSAPTWLAVANSHGYALRIAGAVTTLAMAVIFTLTYGLTQTTVMRAVAADLDAGTQAQATIGAPALGGVPDDLITAVRAVPGVRTAAPVSTTTVLWPTHMFGDTTTDSVSALVLTPAATGVVDLGIQSGSLDRLTGNTMAAAASGGASLGSTVSLILGDGTPVEATVVALYGRDLGFGPVVLSRDLVAGHTTTGLDQSVLVGTDGSGTTQQRLAALVASRPGVTLDLGRLGSDGSASDGPASGGPFSGGRGAVPPEVWINIAVLGVLLGYLLLGIANKLVATTAQRRGELAALRLIGTTPRQIRAMMRREAALISAIAVIVGTLLAAVPLVLLGIGVLHRPWPAGPVWLLPATVLTVAVIAFAALGLPTRRALRVAPAHALGNREIVFP